MVDPNIANAAAPHSEMFWYILIGSQLIFFSLTVVALYFYIQRRNRLLLTEKALHFKQMTGQSLQDLIDQAQKQNLKAPLDVALNRGVYPLEKELQIAAPVRLIGLGVNETRLAAKGNRMAIDLNNVKDCLISNMTIHGKIQCSNSEVQLDNCQILANEDGICIEARDGSIVTVSGLIRGDGGIAIRACGESKVILKQPYAISGDDYLVRDPKSSISIQPGIEGSSSNLPQSTQPAV